MAWKNMLYSRNVITINKAISPYRIYLLRIALNDIGNVTMEKTVKYQAIRPTIGIIWSSKKTNEPNRYKIDNLTIFSSLLLTRYNEFTTTGNRYKINPKIDFDSLASYAPPYRYLSSYFTNESIEEAIESNVEPNTSKRNLFAIKNNTNRQMKHNNTIFLYFEKSRYNKKINGRQNIQEL